MVNSLDSMFKVVITDTAVQLLAFGFKKDGNRFRKLCDKSSALIEFQKSQSSSREQIIFTINLAVVCGPLLDTDGVSLQKARAVDGHLRERIGALIGDRQDKWWRIDASTDVDRLAVEVIQIIINEAVPYLLRYVEPDNLFMLWQEGHSPGLTEFMRLRKLEELRIALKDEGS